LTVDDLADVLNRLSRIERAMMAITPPQIWAAIAEQDRAILPPVPPAPEPRAPLTIQAVANSLGLFDYFGQTRAVLEAWAFAKGLPLVGTKVPDDAMRNSRTICQARASGKSWRASIEAAGLNVPDESIIAEQALAVRLETAALMQYLAEMAQAMLERDGNNPHSKPMLAAALQKIWGAGT
jgi:hypothetical protein